jgi:hypothetical protein
VDWWRARTWQEQAAALLLVAAALAATAAALVFLLRDGGGSRAAEPQPTAAAEPSLTPTVSPTPAPTPVRFAGILDGTPMSEAEWEARRGLLPLAVMVDNSPQGLPQAGLAQADLVYEAFVEGGITRFMAVFWRQDPSLVAPVRSARTPFLVWASELGALFAHAGGAETANDANAIGQIYEWGLLDLEAFAPPASDAFFRMDDREAPHNLAAKGVDLRTAAAALGYQGPPTLQPWPFKADGGTGQAPSVGAFEVDFSGRRDAAGVIQWYWDGLTGSWLRFQAGGPARDAGTGRQLSFRNVVVMRAPHEVVDDSGHVLYEQFGQGEATVFLDGRAIAATWQKKDRTDRTRFYDAGGQEVAFNRGPIFIEVVGPESLLFTAATPDGLEALPPYEPPPPGPADEPTPTLPPPSPTRKPSPMGTRTPARTASPGPGLTPTPPTPTKSVATKPVATATPR